MRFLIPGTALIHLLAEAPLKAEEITPPQI